VFSKPGTGQPGQAVATNAGIHAFQVSSSPTATQLPTPVPTSTPLSQTKATKATPENSSWFINFLTTPWLNLPFVNTLTAAMMTIMIALCTYVFRRVSRYRTKQKERKLIKEEDEKRKREEKQSEQQYLNVYRQKLPSMVSKLQVLDIVRSLGVAEMYVKLRLLERPKPTYELDPLLRKAIEQSDPMDELKLSRSYWESRMEQALEVETVLRDNRHCVITGDPGAGKTTMLKYLTLQALGGKLSGLPDLPIYLTLSTFAEFLLVEPWQHKDEGSRKPTDLVDYAAFEWQRLCGFPRESGWRFIDQQLRAGEVLLLLDALDEAGVGRDEVEQREMQQRVVNEVKRLRSSYDKAHIVVTARKAGYSQLGGLPDFRALETLDFGPEDIHNFVKNWFKQTGEPDKAYRLISDMDMNQRILSLAANPLLLSLIVTVFDEDLKLPERRAELYKRCVARMLGEEAGLASRPRPRGFSSWEKERLLESIAWEFQVRRARYLDDVKLMPLLEKSGKGIGLAPAQMREMLHQLDVNDGLLREQAVKMYGFLHLTIQEYFAANFAKKNGLLAYLLKSTNDVGWEEVILLYAGIVEEPTQLLQGLLDREDFFANRLNLAGRCLTAMPTNQQPSQLRARIISDLFKVLKNSSYLMIRRHTANTLAELSRTDAVVKQRLITLLSDTSTDTAVSENIARALGEYGDAIVAPELLSLLSRIDLERRVRSSITVALSRLRSSEIISPLFALLDDKNTDSSVRSDVATIICNLGNASQPPKLIKFLLDENEDVLVRSNIALGWAVLGDRSTLPQLVDLLAEPRLNQLISIGIIDAVSKAADSHLMDRLRSLILDAHVDLYTRAYIARVLVKSTDAAKRNELLKLLFNPLLPEQIFEGMVEAFGQLRDLSIIPELQNLRKQRSMSQSVEITVMVVLARLGDHTVDRDLSRLLKARALTQYQYRIILEQLDLSIQLDTLLNRQGLITLRVAAVQALGKIYDKALVEPLRELVADKGTSKDIRRECLALLRALASDRKTAEVLAEVINTETALANDAVETLWSVSRKARLRVVRDPLRNEVEIREE
jgi:HEAT repeat protein